MYLKQVSVIFWCTNKIKLKRYKEDETMLECLKKINKEKTGLFAAGVLFGTAGIKILTSKDAKKLYTQCTAAVLRALAVGAADGNRKLIVAHDFA